jgi:hypothetical protein
MLGRRPSVPASARIRRPVAISWRVAPLVEGHARSLGPLDLASPAVADAGLAHDPDLDGLAIGEVQQGAWWLFHPGEASHTVAR